MWRHKLFLDIKINLVWRLQGLSCLTVYNLWPCYSNLHRVGHSQLDYIPMSQLLYLTSAHQWIKYWIKWVDSFINQLCYSWFLQTRWSNLWWAKLVFQVIKLYYLISSITITERKVCLYMLFLWDKFYEFRWLYSAMTKEFPKKKKAVDPKLTSAWFLVIIMGTHINYDCL